LVNFSVAVLGEQKPKKKSWKIPISQSVSRDTDWDLQPSIAHYRNTSIGPQSGIAMSLCLCYCCWAQLIQLDWFRILLPSAVRCMLGLILLLWYYIVHCRITFGGDSSAIPYYNTCFVVLYFDTIQKVVNSSSGYQ